MVSLGLASCSDDKTIKIYDLRSNQILQHYNAHAGAVNQISFHPSGFYLGSVSNDSKVKIWDLRKGEALYSLYGHSGAVKAISFSNAGDYFTTGGDDKMLLIWKTNVFDSKSKESKVIKKKKRYANGKVITFPKKAAKEKAAFSKSIIEESSLVQNSLAKVTDSMPENPVFKGKKKFVELEIDDRINSTLDVILGQLDKIRVNIKVSLTSNTAANGQQDY